MPEPVHETVAAVRWLDRLAAALEARGYPCETRYLAVPALLEVRHPEVPDAPETVAAILGASYLTYDTRVWWFQTPTGLICECDQTRLAVVHLRWALTVRAAVRRAERARRCREGGRGHG